MRRKRAAARKRTSGKKVETFALALSRAERETRSRDDVARLASRIRARFAVHYVNAARVFEYRRGSQRVCPLSSRVVRDRSLLGEARTYRSRLFVLAKEEKSGLVLTSRLISRNEDTRIVGDSTRYTWSGQAIDLIFAAYCVARALTRSLRRAGFVDPPL